MSLTGALLGLGIALEIIAVALGAAGCVVLDELWPNPRGYTPRRLWAAAGVCLTIGLVLIGATT